MDFKPGKDKYDIVYGIWALCYLQETHCYDMLASMLDAVRMGGVLYFKEPHNDNDTLTDLPDSCLTLRSEDTYDYMMSRYFTVVSKKTEAISDIYYGCILYTLVKDRNYDPDKPSRSSNRNHKTVCPQCGKLQRQDNLDRHKQACKPSTK